jgi:hypothetical protein
VEIPFLKKEYSCYFFLVSGDLKSYDRQTIYTIIWANRAVPGNGTLSIILGCIDGGVFCYFFLPIF